MKTVRITKDTKAKNTDVFINISEKEEPNKMLVLTVNNVRYELEVGSAIPVPQNLYKLVVDSIKHNESGEGDGDSIVRLFNVGVEKTPEQMYSAATLDRAFKKFAEANNLLLPFESEAIFGELHGELGNNSSGIVNGVDV